MIQPSTLYSTSWGALGNVGSGWNIVYLISDSTYKIIRLYLVAYALRRSSKSPMNFSSSDTNDFCWFIYSLNLSMVLSGYFVLNS